MCGRLPVGKGFFDGDTELVGAAMCPACLCGTVTWAAGHNALRRSGSDQKHAVNKLQWLKWSVLIFRSISWVHYSSVSLSNFVSAGSVRNFVSAGSVRTCFKRPMIQAQHRGPEIRSSQD